MSRRRPRRGSRRGTSPTTELWGRPQERPTPPDRIRPTPDPAAVLRSLGDPPLPGTASHQLAVVYEEAVRAATALAAANDLLEPETPASD